MRLTITATLGAALLGGALAVAGPASSPARSAADGELVPFQDCDTLLRWYVDRAVGEVGPWGWGGQAVPMYAEDSMRATAPQPSSSPDAGVANGSTGTNTQEVGVDEPDTAKTDGRLVVRLRGDRAVVVTDVTGARPRDLATWRVPAGQSAQDLLLVDDHVLVTSRREVVPMTARVGPDFPVSPLGTTLTDLDLADPARPVVAGTTTWSGSRLSLRRQGDVVRLVTSTGLPDLPFVQPGLGRLGAREATAKNRAIVRASRIEDWLPGVDTGTGREPAVSCADVLHPTDDGTTPRDRADLDTLTVATFRPGEVPDAATVAVTAAGDDVYASTDRLYVTSTTWGSLTATTRIHAFALDGDRTGYVASGSVAGSVRDHWSLDEHDGDLRVAVAWPGRDGGTRDNGVVVLRESGGRLVQVGAVRGLGVGEDVQSVRWFDDLAVLVTFRQVDPVWTVDLRDPAHPRTLGELELPGFSSYLHPIGRDRLLGLGTDADADGRVLGSQAAVLDLRDPTAVRRLDQVRLGGRDAHLGVADDPHAFTWLPGIDAAVTTLTDWSTSETGRVLLLRVGSDGTITVRDLPQPGGYAVRALPLPDGRLALVGDEVLLTRVG